jgi:hypothetical protein
LQSLEEAQAAFLPPVIPDHSAAQEWETRKPSGDAEKRASKEARKQGSKEARKQGSKEARLDSRPVLRTAGNDKKASRPFKRLPWAPERMVTIFSLPIKKDAIWFVRTMRHPQREINKLLTNRADVQIPAAASPA